MANISKKTLVSQINKLKKEKGAIILVHNYQRPELFDVADFIGDSLDLCKQAAKTDARIILFCGVSFMAESAVVLNPDKKVLMPYLDSGCAMADMLDLAELKQLQKKHPRAATVCYVNTTAEIKANSDICCTSANAVDVVRSLPNSEIIFLPDQNLANYVQTQVPDKKIIPWAGYCPIHHVIDAGYIKKLRKQHPKAKIIVHPESKPEVLGLADYISGTTGMIKCAMEDDATEFYVLTECGMLNRLKKELPKKKFYGICNLCFDMKKNDLEAVLKCLKNERPVVKVDKDIIKKAAEAFNRMFELN